MGKLYCVNICGIRGVVKSIDLCNTEEQFKSMTVEQLKDKIRQTFPATPGKKGLRLIFTNKMLDEDFKPLCEYGIQHMSFIQVVLRLPGGRCLHVEEVI
uniref:Ubiquitin-like domain-containing protein n=1 Tax=Neolamprologus brichardi TaxID=32507 RepID=A0A3Q4GCI0_NEOBR